MNVLLAAFPTNLIGRRFNFEPGSYFELDAKWSAWCRALTSLLLPESGSPGSGWNAGPHRRLGKSLQSEPANQFSARSQAA